MKNSLYFGLLLAMFSYAYPMSKQTIFQNDFQEDQVKFDTYTLFEDYLDEAPEIVVDETSSDPAQELLTNELLDLDLDEIENEIESPEEEYKINHQLDQDLFAAVCNNNINSIQEVKRLLSLKERPDINAQNPQGYTPLMLASLYELTDMVKTLVALGADLDIQAPDGKTALIFAVYRDHLAIAQVLIDAKADINKKDSYGFTPLEWAVTFDRVAIVEALIEANVILDTQNKYGVTALMEAVRSGHIAIIHALLKAGANLYIKNNDGKTVFDLDDYRPCVPSIYMRRILDDFVNLTRPKKL